MSEDAYSRARKAALKEYHARMQQGKSPFLPVLSEVDEQLNALSRQSLGLVQVPLSKVVGTASRGRTNAFAANFMPLLESGDIIDARITHCESFGAFADIGCGIVALMPIDCISVSRIAHPKERFFDGMFIKAAVKSRDAETGRLFLTHKELLGTFAENCEAFAAGQTVAGTVRGVEPYGAFVELTPNLAGLADLRDGIASGQRATVYIKSIFPDRMKLKLVILDVGEPVQQPKRFDYFKKEGRIDRWVYSPPGCRKVIETVFG